MNASTTQQSLCRRDYYRSLGGSLVTRSCTGITLIEILVVVAIVAILAAVAAPNLSDLFINNRLSTAANEVVTAINTARSEAMRRGTVVTMQRCAAVDSATGCAQASSAAADWSKGWFMFVDVNRNRQWNSGEEVLRVGQVVKPEVNSPLTLYQNTLTIGSAAQNGSVGFCPDGRVFGVDCAEPTSAGNWSTIFVICYEEKLAVANKPRSRAILVNREGRVRIASQDASGVPLNETETPLASTDGCTAPKYQW
jgi:type IV fimbrial biogenesis protein FimT